MASKYSACTKTAQIALSPKSSIYHRLENISEKQKHNFKGGDLDLDQVTNWMESGFQGQFAKSP